MIEMVFASQNKKKTEEMQALLAPEYKILNLADIGCMADIPETGISFAENAALKTAYIKTHYKLDGFADDSGLEVEVLNGEPGIYSARYAGARGDVLNMEFLLNKMAGIANRRANFTCAISLQFRGEAYLFEGKVFGNLLTAPRGKAGFGYDPIFVPEGYAQTFAEMDATEKNKISHRALAVAKLRDFLKAQV
ncbi:MAG: RdgB/HAM1 family non-canonical purine NTP pyrophosphatase [Pedobacter sp.]|nr:MAG: RdgB/HAM1 family non-canonical purine NTP pyrophosphatase [Pedobacter sp.]